MSPQLAAEERMRRLAPLAVAAGALALALLPRAAAPTDAQLASAALIAVAAAVISHAIAAARGVTGIVAGAAAGLWLAAAAVAATAAADHPPTAAALAAAAAAAALLGRAAARDRALDPPLAAAPAAVLLTVLDPRAWALAAAVAALIALRDHGRRRWLAAAPALTALAAGLLTLLAALGHAPAFAPHHATIAPTPWLELAVDRLGPIALVLAAIGVAAVATDRRGRWLAVALAGGLVALLPLTAAPATAGLVGVALALGTTLSAAAARVGRPRHQVVTATALAAMMIAPFVL